MLNLSLVKQEYEYLDNAVFLNSSSVSVPPMRVRNACRSVMDDLAEACGLPAYDAYDRIRSQTKQMIANLLNASPEEIAFIKNTTEGNSLLAHGLDLKPGDSVVLCDLEHQSLLYPWLYRQNTGIHVRIVRSRNGSFTLDDIAAQTDETTRVIAVSAVQYGSGCLADLNGIGSYCQKHGIIFAVDAIQALGKIPVDVKTMHIDYLTCGAFKGLLGSLGIAFLYCKKNLIPHIEPVNISYHNVMLTAEAPDLLSDFSAPELRTDIHRLEAGSSNTYGIISLNKGVELILDLGTDNIFFHILELEKHLRDRLKDSGYAFYDHDPRAGFSGVVCMRYPEKLTPVIQEAFKNNKIYATIKPGYLRMSLEFFNTAEQMDLTADTLLRCIRSI